MEDQRDFCAEMRAKTKAIHDKSDRLINLKLAVVLTDTKLWARALADFYFVFQTIENVLEVYKEHPHVGPLVNPHMLRTDAYEKDLEYYLGKQWRGLINPSEPAKRYCDRVIHAANEDPSLLIAYVHSMYLALVAGGQMLKKIIKKTLGLTSGEGLSIFDFEDINRSELRKHIHSAINDMELDRAKKDAIIAEKIRVFEMNNAIAASIKPTLTSYSRLSMFGALLIIVISMVSLLLYYGVKQLRS